MSELKSLDEIEIGYSKSQMYWRVKKLVEGELIEPPKRGKRNQYLLGEDEVETLKRLAKLEKEHDTVREAIAKLRSVPKTDQSHEGSKDKVEKLENRISDLEEEVEVLNQSLADQKAELKGLRERWKEQFRGSIERVKDLFK